MACSRPPSVILGVWSLKHECHRTEKSWSDPPHAEGNRTSLEISTTPLTRRTVQKRSNSSNANSFTPKTALVRPRCFTCAYLWGKSGEPMGVRKEWTDGRGNQNKSPARRKYLLHKEVVWLTQSRTAVARPLRFPLFVCQFYCKAVDIQPRRHFSEKKKLWIENSIFGSNPYQGAFKRLSPFKSLLTGTS